MSMMKRLAILVAEGRAVVAYGEYQFHCTQCKVWFPMSSVPQSVVEDILSGSPIECYDCLMEGANK